jgi:molybdate transport system substrate-binding protein
VRPSKRLSTLAAAAAALLFSLGLAHAEAPAATSAPSAPAQGATVTVFAAASLKNALDEAAEAFKGKSGIEAKIGYAASMTLARQIEAGAPSEIFIAADAASMDYLAARKLIDPATRVDLLGNSLVLVAPKTAPFEKLSLKPEPLLAALGKDGRIAMGDPASVPAGKYGKASFEKLGLWGEIEPRAAFADTVRSALLFVARGEAPLGVVYETDARVEPKVKTVAVFPPSSHPRIVYPLAATAQAGSNARRFVDFLKSPAARAIFEKQGFAYLPR